LAFTAEYCANPFIVKFEGAGAAWAAVKAWDPPAKCRVIDAWLVLTGTAAGTIQITDGTNAITAAETLATSDKDIQSMASIDDAHRDLIPGTDTLTLVPGSSPIADLYVLLVWTT